MKQSYGAMGNGTGPTKTVSMLPTPMVWVGEHDAEAEAKTAAWKAEEAAQRAATRKRVDVSSSPPPSPEPQPTPVAVQEDVVEAPPSSRLTPKSTLKIDPPEDRLSTPLRNSSMAPPAVLVESVGMRYGNGPVK